jgi:CMP-N,N'-diacetyllegionaminic acid synthase
MFLKLNFIYASMAEILALIPARAGSKSIVGKNIRPFKGKPLLCHSIDHAKAATLVTRIIISTDSEQYADIAKKHGAEVPFLRPIEFAQDDTLDYPVFEHALNWLAEHENYHPDVIVHLRPTAPFRDPKQIDAAIQLLLDTPEADAVRSVIEAKDTPYKMWRIEKNKLVPLLRLEGNPEPYNSPRQSLPKIYWQNANIDVVRATTILEKKSMTGEVILPFVMRKDADVDIDTTADLERARKVKQ